MLNLILIFDFGQVDFYKAWLSFSEKKCIFYVYVWHRHYELQNYQIIVYVNSFVQLLTVMIFRVANVSLIEITTILLILTFAIDVCLENICHWIQKWKRVLKVLFHNRISCIQKIFQICFLWLFAKTDILEDPKCLDWNKYKDKNEAMKNKALSNGSENVWVKIFEVVFYKLLLLFLFFLDVAFWILYILVWNRFRLLFRLVFFLTIENDLL